MSYIELFHSRVELLRKGRRDGEWIPSLDEWEAKIGSVHNIAKKGCPFAMQFVRDIEVALDTTKERVQEFRDELAKERSESEIEFVSQKRSRQPVARVELAGYSPIAVAVLTRMAELDRLRSEYFESGANGLGSTRSYSIRYLALERLVRGIKHKPYRYIDEGIRSWEYQGTLEWVSAVKRLYKEPERKAYEPKYYLMNAEAAVKPAGVAGVDSAAGLDAEGEQRAEAAM